MSYRPCAAILAKALTDKHDWANKDKRMASMAWTIRARAGDVRGACGVRRGPSADPNASAPAMAPPADEASQTLARDIFQHVIGMETSVEGHRVPQMANYLAGLFRQAGFRTATFTSCRSGDTASLIVRYRGDGSGGRPIILMAHMDVVTAHRSDWQRDPFTLVEENGYFFGRGASDIKNGVSILSATLLRLKAEHFHADARSDLVFQRRRRDLGTNHHHCAARSSRPGRCRICVELGFRRRLAR